MQVLEILSLEDFSLVLKHQLYTDTPVSLLADTEMRNHYLFIYFAIKCKERDDQELS